jgi:predicted PurR-regulated permease PerM
VKKLPEISKQAEQMWPAGAAYIHGLTSEFARPPQAAEVKQWLPRGIMAVGAIAAVVFALVLVLYLLVDGRRFAAWLVTFAPKTQRKKLVATLDEVRPLVFAYVRGNLITSVLSFIAACAVLFPLHVPAALPLALLAFIGDFIPVAGFIVSLAPAVLLAATVSPTAALIVAAGYFGYQALENYIISPRVYGKNLELSPLAVVLGIAVGGSLAGPVGAILILPFIASWPAVEKIWLAERLPPDTIEKHDELGKDGDDAAKEIL